MCERTRLGLGILGGALALGGLADMLLRATPWGINLFLWVLALVLVAILLARFGGIRPVGDGRWLVPLAVLFAAGLAWRDSPTVVVLDVLAVLISLSLAVVWGKQGNLRRAGLSGYLVGGMYAGVLSSAGPVPVVVRDIQWSEVACGRWRDAILAVVRGMLIAIPVILVFGGLLVAADAVFQGLVLDLFWFDLSEVVGHLILISIFAWLSAGAIWAALLARDTGDLSVARPHFLSLGIVEIGIVLGLLNALFLVFVTVQIQYLFGGAERVLVSAGLTYAEYARRGFFELVTATSLALPLLLLLHWLLRAGGRAATYVFRPLTALLIAMLFIVMASALQRMYLYTSEFGLTEPRLYATIFMAWIFVVLLWFLFTVLLGRRERFAFGTLASAFATILLINVMNPDALIAQVNINRMEAGEKFDPFYLTSLSADAAPVLVEALPKIGRKSLFEEVMIMPSGEKRPVESPTVEEAIIEQWRADRSDWRTWNLARARADSLTERLD